MVCYNCYGIHGWCPHDEGKFWCHYTNPDALRTANPNERAVAETHCDTEQTGQWDFNWSDAADAAERSALDSHLQLSTSDHG